MLPKAQLRADALARRRALPPAEVARRSDRLRELLWREYAGAGWRWLHVFLPLPAEPDTWFIIRQVWGEGWPLRLAAPVVGPGGALRHYELTPATPLVRNRWGIEEPAPDPAAEVAPAALDAVLVPLLYCDRRGQRVGYGGGYYDRFLARCRPDAQFIGLSLLAEAPGPPIADVEATDVPLDALVTPERVWKF